MKEKIIDEKRRELKRRDELKIRTVVEITVR